MKKSTKTKTACDGARVELAHQEKKHALQLTLTKKNILAQALNMQLNTSMCPNKKNEQSSSHLCHLICERHSFVACATPFLHILNMAAAVWQLVNENDGACVIAVFNAVLHCHAILLLLFHELVVVTSLAITVVLQLMYWAQQSMWLNACCGGLVCEDCVCAP